jgi:sugar phosphate isomerase/epimerase
MHADELGLYLQVGVGRVNPYNTPLSPEIRQLGEGDYLLGMHRMIDAAASIGCFELWGECATYMHGLPGLFAIDRFRTDVSWPDQLEATQKFLRKLAPILRDHGCRINLETHEEVTSYELLRFIDETGKDVLGITYDTMNMVCRGEAPLSTAQRVAPFTHMTHIKDAILYFTEEGLEWQLRPCGQGVIDWGKVLPILSLYSPDLILSIEDAKSIMPIKIYDPMWQDHHPDISAPELTELVRLAKVCENKIANREIPDPKTYHEIPYDDENRILRFHASADYLRQVIKEKELMS